jgi:hypothetical protein
LFYCGQNKSVKENKMSDSPQPRGLLNWWQGLILAAGSAIVGVAAAVMIMTPGASTPGSAPSWAMMLLRFVPHFLLLFGILADAFTYEGVYWTGTMVGILSTIVAPYIDMGLRSLGELPGVLMRRRTDAAAQQGGDPEGTFLGCSITGSQVTQVPEALVVTASILSYYIFDLMFNMSVLDATGALVAGSVLYGGQVFAISSCFKDGKTGEGAAWAGAYGVIIGLIWYSILWSWGPSYLPSSILSGSITAGGGANGKGGRGGPGRKGVGMSGSGDPVDSGMAGGSGRPGQAKTCPS